MSRLQTNRLGLAYGRQPAVVHGLSLSVPDGAITTIIGPNGCGKSSLLRALARLLRPRQGSVLLDGADIHRLPTREVARQLGLLSQQSSAPDAIRVVDLVQRGRYPHQAFFQPSTAGDQAAVERALLLTGMSDLAGRPVDELSGGQRQKAWIAMALAQETPILLLDEPTSFLDVSHQQEVLTLVRRLNREEGRTILMVLHDVNQAVQVSHHLVAMREGKIFVQGTPQTFLDPDRMNDIFGQPCDRVTHPVTGQAFSVPRSRAAIGREHAIPSSLHQPNITALRADGLSTGYDQSRQNSRQVLKRIDLAIPAGQITVLVGPNACGKSTLLKTLAHLMDAREGKLWLNGSPAGAGSQRRYALQVAFQAQESAAPAGYRVEDLVALGRFPHQTWYRQWSQADQRAVENAMSAAGVVDLCERPVDELSGGQKQRAWLAMALAQETPILLLDEPTTYLDMSNQVEILDLVWRLNREHGRTVVMALHDLSMACRYADHLVILRDGQVAAAGPPEKIITAELVGEVFGVRACIVTDPRTGKPLVLQNAD